MWVFGVPAWVAWLLALGYVLFITYVITRSRLFASERTFMITRYGPESWQAEGISCPFCVGFWWSLATCAYMSFEIDLRMPVWTAAVFTGAFVTGAVIVVILPED